MSEGQPHAIARYLRASFGPDPGGPTDSELLSRFAATGDQASFELLVWRHAGMVQAACRRVLNDRHIAEDAAQATFMVLARKAGAVRDNPAGWLYRVARRIAAKMHADARALPLAEKATTEIRPEVGHDDVQVLHDELAQLPEKYRVPVLLCFFEGLTHQEAAHRLGWPSGSVAGRIARAKDMLFSRLKRRGVAIPAAGLAALCSVEPMSRGDVAVTAHNAIAFATGQTAGLSPPLITLAHGAIHAMTVAKIKMYALAASALIAVTTIGGLGVAYAQQRASGGAGGPPVAGGSGSRTGIGPGTGSGTGAGLGPRQSDSPTAKDWHVMIRSSQSVKGAQSLPVYMHTVLTPSKSQYQVLDYRKDAKTISPDGTMAITESRNEIYLERLKKDPNAYDRFSKLESDVSLQGFDWSADSKTLIYVTYLSRKSGWGSGMGMPGGGPGMAGSSGGGADDGRKTSTLIRITIPNGNEELKKEILYSTDKILAYPRYLPGSSNVLIAQVEETKNKESKFKVLQVLSTKESKRQIPVNADPIPLDGFAVSPDGKRIAFGNSNLTVVELTSGKVIGQSKMSDVNPEWPVVFGDLIWRPDGKAIAFKPKFVGGITVGPGQRFEDVRVPGDESIGVATLDGTKLTTQLYTVPRGMIPCHWTDKLPQIEAMPGGMMGMGMGPGGGGMAPGGMGAGMGMPGGSMGGLGLSGPGGGEGGLGGGASGAPSGSGGGEGGLGGATGAPFAPVQRLTVSKDLPSPISEEDIKRKADFAQRARSKENLKQIMRAVHNHHDATGSLPKDIADAKGKVLLSWRVALLPYLGEKESSLFNKFKMNEPWDSVHNKKLLDEMPTPYRAGFEAKDATKTYYQAFRGPVSWLGQSFNSITDGTSNTIGVAEIGPAVTWTQPADTLYDPAKPFPKMKRPFANTLNVGMLDGSTKTLNPVGEFDWRHMIDRDDGHNIDFEKWSESFPANSDEEKAELKKITDENQAKIKQLQKHLQDIQALYELENASQTEFEKAKALGEELQRLIDTFAPKAKKMRDSFGIPPGRPIPAPEQLNRK